MPPPGATKIQINSSLMGWVDANGVVLHSWRKTKRGTRGGGQRRRQEADAASASTSERAASAPGAASAGAVAGPADDTESSKGSASEQDRSETVTPMLPGATAADVPSTEPSSAAGASTETGEAPSLPPPFSAEQKDTPLGHDEHGMPTTPRAGRARCDTDTAQTTPDGQGASVAGRQMTPRLGVPSVAHAPNDSDAASPGQQAGADSTAEQASTPKANAPAVEQKTPERALEGSTGEGARVKVPVKDWEHLRAQHDQVRFRAQPCLVLSQPARLLADVDVSGAADATRDGVDAAGSGVHAREAAADGPESSGARSWCVRGARFLCAVLLVQMAACPCFGSHAPAHCSPTVAVSRKPLVVLCQPGPSTLSCAK